MPGDYTYFRKYFILNSDYTNINNINPKGHGKVELRGTKGIVRISMEDCEKEEEYRVYLLKEQYGFVEELELGRIITDERGRARKDININLKELESKGFALGETDAILIKRDAYILLAGYIDKDSHILDRYIKESPMFKMEQVEEPQEEARLTQNEEIQEAFKEVQLSYVEEPQSVQNQEIQQAEDTSHLSQIEEANEPQETQYEPEHYDITDHEVQHDQYQQSESEDLSKYFPAGLADEMPDMENEYDVTREEPIVEEFSQDEYPIVEEPQTHEPVQESSYEIPQNQYSHEYYQEVNRPSYQTYEYTEYVRRLNHKNQMTNYILSVLKFFPQVQPLKVYLHGYTWWRIDDNGTNSYRGFLPYYNYLLSANYQYPFMQNSTTCLNLIRKYGHYLFGLYKEGNETKYYVYAVPGRFTVEEHPFKGITGFNTWYDSIDGVGYWILYIDPLMGKIIYPINPMVPID